VQCLLSSICLFLDITLLTCSFFFTINSISKDFLKCYKDLNLELVSSCYHSKKLAGINEFYRIFGKIPQINWWIMCQRFSFSKRLCLTGLPVVQICLLMRCTFIMKSRIKEQPLPRTVLQWKSSVQQKMDSQHSIFGLFKSHERGRLT